MAAENRVLVARPRVGGSPRVLALLASPCRCILPLGLGRQKAAIPDTERVRFVPVHAVYRQVLLASHRKSPCRFVTRRRRHFTSRCQICIGRRAVAVVRSFPFRLVGSSPPFKCVCLPEPAAGSQPKPPFHALTN